jgi:hydrogenase maturation protease
MTILVDPGPSPIAWVIGLGNEWRGDDAVGLLVCAALTGRVPPGVGLAHYHDTVLPVLDHCRADARLLLIDCLVSGAPPGTLRTLDLLAAPGIAAHTTSGHLLGLQQVIGLAQQLQHAPASTILVGIEGGCFDRGAGLTPAVARAIPAAVDRILTLAERGRIDRG